MMRSARRIVPWLNNLEREKDMAVSLKRRDKHEEVYRKRLATNKAAFDQMTEEQQKVVRDAQVALRSFVSDFSDSFDVTTSTARELQDCFWRMNNAFRTEEDAE
jgi:hypothetical protein